MTVNLTRIEAKKKLCYFVEKKLINYSKLRNFIFDNQNQLTTSCLSPYITHGILNENEVINESLKKHPFSKCEKFIEEILWRVYWRGWLELRPQLWKDYLKNYKKIDEDLKDNPIYKAAIDGKTNIQCFDDWVVELKENNYLHNHVRMWFASIWIFTLNLPWELGAAFFIKYLYDGDIASNTLSWRWVAGLQTKGKNYLAKEWNIRKFTYEKYNHIKLNETALPLNTIIDYPIQLREFKNPKITGSDNLLIFDNSLSFEINNNKNSFKKIFVVINNNRKIALSKNVIELKNKFINDQINRLVQEKINCEIINIEEINKIDSNFYALYPNIGENLDFINSYNTKKITFLYRNIDQYSWKYCDKGFFNFKKHIPNIIKNFC